MMKMRMMLAVMFGSLLVLGSAGTAGTVSAVHESNNNITFQANADLDADGRGTINYVSGREGEPNEWVSSFRFRDLTPGATYTVTAYGPGRTTPIVICTFTAGSNGTGGCAERFPSLPGLAIVEVTSGGVVALDAYRSRGDIISRGGNR